MIVRNNEFEKLILLVIKTLLFISITISIVTVMIDLSYMNQYINNTILSTKLLGINFLQFIVVFTLFMIPISRLAIMIREFSKSDKYMNVVTELVVLIIILVLAARIVI